MKSKYYRRLALIAAFPIFLSQLPCVSAFQSSPESNNSESQNTVNLDTDDTGALQRAIDDRNTALVFQEGLLLAKRGIFMGEMLSANAYLHGLVGVTGKNEAEALKWYVRAAQHDRDGLAAFEVGNIFTNRKSQRDKSQALKWYIRSARQGHPDAEAAVGFLYFLGKNGTPKDKVQALKWAEIGNGHSNPKSWMLLGALYAEGSGADHDEVAAYSWLRQAVDGGVTEASELLKDLAQRMTITQMTSAELQVRQRRSLDKDLGSSLKPLGRESFGTVAPALTSNDFQWNDSCFLVGSGYSFSLHNSLARTVEHVRVEFDFFDSEHRSIDVEFQEFIGELPPGMTKSVAGDFGSRIKKLVACKELDSQMDRVKRYRSANDPRSEKKRQATDFEDSARDYTEWVDAMEDLSLANRATYVVLRMVDY